MAATEGLSLYHYRACAFCARVRRATERLGLELELRDVQLESERRAELMAATGRGTVPVLRIEEAPGEIRWLPESSDIIRYLEGRFGDGKC
jgi:glutathione S-transferase